MGVNLTVTAPHPRSAGNRGLQDLKAGEQHPLPPSSSSKLPGLWGAVAGLVQRYKPSRVQAPLSTPSSGRKQSLAESLGIHSTCSPRKINPVLSELSLEPFPLSSIPGSWHWWHRKEMPLWDAGGLEELLFPARWIQP